jgi:hypothetical protein
MKFPSLASSFSVFIAACSVARAQPSPDVQRRISAAIEAAIINGSSSIDYTAFVNPFIGTGTFLHQPSDHMGPSLKYTIFLPDNDGDVWFVSVRNESSICLPTHTLYGTAQAHLFHLAWYVVFCDVPKDRV